MSGIQIIGS